MSPGVRYAYPSTSGTPSPGRQPPRPHRVPQRLLHGTAPQPGRSGERPYRQLPGSTALFPIRHSPDLHGFHVPGGRPGRASLSVPPTTFRSIKWSSKKGGKWSSTRTITFPSVGVTNATSRHGARSSRPSPASSSARPSPSTASSARTRTPEARPSATASPARCSCPCWAVTEQPLCAPSPPPRGHGSPCTPPSAWSASTSRSSPRNAPRSPPCQVCSSAARPSWSPR